MIASNEQQKDFLLELDDEQDTTTTSRTTIDSGHQFLNFSRKVTKASSMRKPVDIQLGIACGKDLMFTTSPSRILRQHRPLASNHSNKAALPPTSPPPLVRRKSSKKKLKKEVKEEKNNTMTVKILSPSTVAKPNTTYINSNKKMQPSSPQPTSKNTKSDTISSEKPPTPITTTTSRLALLAAAAASPTIPSQPQQQEQEHQHQYQQEQQQELPNITTSSSSHLLDQLVADVLSHIESCPDHSAYSDDLDKLKPKLKAYNITRHSITL